MAIYCLSCGKEIIQKNWGKQRKFCDNNNACKQSYYNRNKKEPKYVRKETFDALEKNLKEVLSKGYDKELLDKVNKDLLVKGNAAMPQTVDTDLPKHSLWKEGDPKENSAAFVIKYGCSSYEELENKLK